MELNELKNTWNKAKSPGQNQLNVNPELMKRMHDQKYQLKLRRIILPEIVGSFVCLAAAGFIGFRFGKLDTALLQGAGVLSILLLLLLPVISFKSTRQLSNGNHVDQSYAETLKAFAHQRVRFVRLQKLNVLLSYLLLVTMLVLLSKLSGGKDLSANKYFWLYSFTAGYVFLLFYSNWVKKYYRKTLQQAEELLQELAA